MKGILWKLPIAWVICSKLTPRFAISLQLHASRLNKCTAVSTKASWQKIHIFLPHLDFVCLYPHSRDTNKCLEGSSFISVRKMINAVLVFNNSGQPRLTKFYTQLVRNSQPYYTSPSSLPTIHVPDSAKYRKQASSNVSSPKSSASSPNAFQAPAISSLFLHSSRHSRPRLRIPTPAL